MSSNLVRWGTLVAMLASVVWMAWTVSSFVASLIPGGQGLEAFGLPSSPLERGVYGVAFVGVLGGLVGLHFLQATRYGWLGAIGFSAASIGALLALADLVIASLVEIDIFEQLLGPHSSSSGLLVGAALLGAGLLLLGTATILARVLPRWCGVALIITVPVCGFLGSGGGGGMLLGLIWLALGGTLWLEAS